MEGLKDRYDAVVIGAGFGGLSAACWLARSGATVAVLERHGKLGGYAQYFGKEPTYCSATHMLSGAAPGGWLHESLSPLGVLDRVELLPLDPSYRLCLPEHDIVIPPSCDAFRDQCAAAFPAEGPGLTAFLDTTRTIGQEFLDLHSASPPGELVNRYQYLTAQHLLAASIKDHRLQAILGGLWPFAGLPPGQLSALHFAALWHTFHQQGGTCAVRGGIRRLSQALADCVTERGGDVLTRACVRRVLRRGRRVTGVELEDATRVQAKTVVAAGNPHDVFNEMLADDDGRTLPYPPLDGVTSISAIQVHLHVDGEMTLPARVNLWHSSYDPDQCFRDLQLAEPDIGTLVLTQLDRCDEDRSPPGTRILSLMSLQPYSRPDAWNVPMDLRRTKDYRTLPEYLELKERMGDRLVAAAENLVPGLGSRVIARKVGTPITLERYTSNTGGAAFGWANIPQQSGLLRPGPRTPFDGLYLAGHWTFPGTGVSAALVSGRLAAEAARTDG